MYDATLAICTWNRARMLDRTLAHVARLAVPHNLSWELLIVNNGCTDSTDEVIKRWSRKLPIRRVFEPTPGASNARNRAAAAALGDLVVCTDDDCVVQKNWLREHVNAAREHPRAIARRKLINNRVLSSLREG